MPEAGLVATDPTIVATIHDVPAFPRKWQPPAYYRRIVDLIETYLWIRARDGRMIPFILNGVQQRYLDMKAEWFAAGKPKDVNALKSRKCGISTLEQAISYITCATQMGQHAVTLAQTTPDTETIFDIARTFYREAMPGSPAKPAIPAKDLAERRFKFHGGRSVFYIGTAGSAAFGRGSTLQRLHCSEVAFWKGKHLDDMFLGIAIAAKFGEVVKETTPRGAAGKFYDLWQQGKRPDGGILNIFIPWWWDDQNRMPVDKSTAARILNELDTEEARLVQLHGLTVEQIAWRRIERAKWGKKFYQEYPEDDETCFLTSGVCFFDEDTLFDLARGFGNSEDGPVLTKKERGNLVVWKPPIKGHRYVIGADPAEGVKGGDFSTAGVLDFDTGEQVARIKGHHRPPEFAKMLARLGKAYNWATLAPEANNHGQSVLDCLRLIERYPTSRIYHHVSVDTDARKRVKKIGFVTSAQTRPLLLDALNQGLEEQFGINDPRLITECRTFNLQDSGKFEADEGAHDDLVIAWGIAYYVRQSTMPLIARPRETAGVDGNGNGRNGS